MELSILLLEDALRQQKEQLNDTEKRNVDPNSPAFEFRKKAIVNLKRFIADLEKGIEALTLLSKQNEALILPVVVKSLPTKDDALNQIGKRLIEEGVEYRNIMSTDKDSGFFTGFLECYKWLTD